MSTTHEDALLRAKAIAARLAGNDDAASEQPPPPISQAVVSDEVTATVPAPKSKRKRWGVAPAAVATTTTPTVASLPGWQEAAAKKAKTTEGEPSKRVWIPTTKERSARHFLAFLGPKLHPLGVSPDLVGASSSSGENKLRFELKGRGSSNAPPVPGIPLEPMHVMIYASDEALLVPAETKLDELIQQAEQAPVEHVEDEEEQANENETGDGNALSPNNANALALLPGSIGNSSYRPATVAQMISSHPLPAGGDMEEIIPVPNGMVGFLIGRGGETISHLQSKSGCKVQIQKEHELKPGQTHREITLQASSQESIDECKHMIERMVEDRMGSSGGGGGGSHYGGGGNGKDAKVMEAVAMGHSLVKVDVPDADVGLIIGKSGATIKYIQESTGAAIQIPQQQPGGTSSTDGVRTVSITAPDEAGAQAAKKQIENLLATKPSFANGGNNSHYNNNGGGGGHQNYQQPQVTIQIMIPDKDVGLCIGRQGCVIKEMQNKSRSRIQIPSHSTPGQPHRVATVTGSQEGCNQVQTFIQRIINEQTSACVMAGTQQANPYYQKQQQYYNNQQGGNQSAEWQAYYAAQAAAAKQQEQQQQAASPAPAAAGVAGGQTADTYHEQFFRYAYYYGEPAARKHYGAWSPAPGTVNPYGVNPNGITAAPATAPAAAPTPAPAPAPTVAPTRAPVAPSGSIRDSGRRKVSNLPAWMTQGK